MNRHELDTSIRPTIEGEHTFVFPEQIAEDLPYLIRGLTPPRQLAARIAKEEAKQDAWFQRLHDTIRAATEEGTLAALQRHEESKRPFQGKVEYNIEPKSAEEG